jgi:hypothetical protein
MNKNPAGTVFFALLTLLLASDSFAQIIAPAYPYIIVTPASPTANKD